MKVVTPGELADELDLLILRAPQRTRELANHFGEQVVRGVQAQTTAVGIRSRTGKYLRSMQYNVEQHGYAEFDLIIGTDENGPQAYRLEVGSGHSAPRSHWGPVADKLQDDFDNAMGHAWDLDLVESTVNTNRPSDGLVE